MFYEDLDTRLKASLQQKIRADLEELKPSMGSLCYRCKKDYVTFEGTNIPFEDMLTFSIYGDEFVHFIPKMSKFRGSKLSENHKEYDFSPHIVIGMVECLINVSHLYRDYGADSFLLTDFFKYLEEKYPIYTDDMSYFNVLLNNKSSDEVKQLESLYPDGYFDKIELSMVRCLPQSSEIEIVEQFTGYLLTLRKLNPKSFMDVLAETYLVVFPHSYRLFGVTQEYFCDESFEARMKLMKIMSKIPELEDSADKFYTRFVKSDEDEIPELFLGKDSEKTTFIGCSTGFDSRLSYDTLKYKYSDDKSGVISNYTAFCTNLFGVLCFGLLSLSNSSSMNFLDLDYLQYKLNTSLGDDIFAYEAKGLSVRKNWRYEIKDAVFQREANELWRKLNISKAKFGGRYQFVSLPNTYRIGSPLLAIARTASSGVVNSVVTKLESGESKIKELEASLSELRSKVRGKMLPASSKDEDKIKTLTSECNSLKKKVKELETLIESKSRIIADISAENERMSADFRRLFKEEEDVVAVIEDDVSLEEKVAFINQFKVLFLNCYLNFDLFLEERNLNNCSVVTSANQFTNPSNAYKADFVVICTNFIAHRIVNKAKKIYNDSVEYFYYSGTNMERLISALYDYMKEYIQK